MRFEILNRTVSRNSNGVHVRSVQVLRVNLYLVAYGLLISILTLEMLRRIYNRYSVDMS